MIDELIVMGVLFFSLAAPAGAQQVSMGIGSPNVNIGINLPLYPDLVPIQGYPVYYAPGLDANYFFYDGMYWVYEEDNWYASSWYNGPWGLVDRGYVPVYILRVPVRYYRQPPVYFRGWQSNAPPRWGEHWGNDWAQRHNGWDRWDRNAVPARPPLPVYQRKYSGDRYPRMEQQQELQKRNYRYQPRDPVVRQQYHAQRLQGAADGTGQEHRQIPRPSTTPGVPHMQTPQQVNRPGQRHDHGEPQHQQPGQEADPHRHQRPQESRQEQSADHEKGRNNNDRPGQERRK